MKRYIIITAVILGVLILLRLVLYPPAHRRAREHVNWVTATDDHNLNCISCHLYTQKDGILAWLINANYLSPFNMALSGDGRTLLVVAEEGDMLLIVDTENRSVLRKIDVGDHPHSVILNHDDSKAYVSNQWSDNVSVIDLAEMCVVDILKTGNGPAGLSLSTSEKFLYIFNS